MPPMCTPEKTDNNPQPPKNIDEFYFIPEQSPNDQSSVDISELDDDSDRDEQEKMDNLLTTFPELEKHFELHGRVGEGTFSTVYVAMAKHSTEDRRFAIKYIVPTCHPERIRFELDCLKTIGGVDNVAGVYCCLRNMNNVAFVMPHQVHNCFSEYVGEMDAAEVKLYMKNLLISLARVHSFNIIHRDIKPSNFLYDRTGKTFLLVDFGLAQKCSSIPTVENTVSKKRKRDDKSSPMGSTGRTTQQATTTNRSSFVQSFEQSSGTQQKKRYACGCYGKAKVCSTCMVQPPMQASRAGTPGFRPPEVLFKVAHQTTALDMWAAGVIMLAILSGCKNFFSCPNDIAALLELVTIFGSDNINKIANKFGRYFLCSEKKPQLDLRKICCTLRSRGTALDAIQIGDKCKTCDQYQRVCLCKNVPLDKSIVDEFPPSAYDLLERLLDLNPKTRITAKDALKHAFFENV